MIIPRAIFLKQSYLKNKQHLKVKISNEKTLIAGQLAIRLRNPQTHKYGTLTCFFCRNKYPILASGTCTELTLSLVSDFSSAGYKVTIADSEGGIYITLDWRESSGENAS